MRGAAMSLPAGGSGLTVFLLLMPVVQGLDGWGVTYTRTHICALEGSTVDISCNYIYPSNQDIRVEKTFWFTKESDTDPVDLRTDSDYTSRVQYDCKQNTCTMRITNLRNSDSAEYKFRFITNQREGRFTGSPGVTLSVTGLEVIESSSRQTQLHCDSSCQLPGHFSYVWYKNGQNIGREAFSISDSFHSADSVSCAVKGHEGFPSPPVCVYGQTCNSVTYSDRRICAVRGSSVDISCTYHSTGWITSKFWISPEQSHQWLSSSKPEDISRDSQYAGRVEVLKTESGRSTLRIRDLRETDSAQYHFIFTTQSFEWGSSLAGTTLTVTDPDLRVLVRRLYQYSSSSWAELECHSRCRLPADPSYIWYKNGQKVRGKTSSTYSTNFYPADSVFCAVQGYEGFPSPPVCVHSRLCTRVMYTSRSICAAKGSSVDISCVYNSNEDRVESKFWFSPGRSHQRYHSQPEDLRKDSQYAGRVQVLETERGCSTLRIRDLSEADSAQYHFKFTTQWFQWRNSLPGTTLTVTALQVQVTRVTVHQSHTEAELKCHSSCSPGGGLSYVWFKNGKKVTTEERSYEDRFNPGDVISCALKGHEDYGSPSVYALNVPSVLVSPSAEIKEGSEVTLTCSSDADSAATYTWNKKNQTLLNNKQQLIFSSIQVSDSGEYYCSAENKLGKRTSESIFISVEYAPKLTSVSVSPSTEIEEGISVTLTCSSDANPAASYTWYNKKNNSDPLSKDSQLVFRSIKSSDSGEFYCTAINQLGRKKSEYKRIDVKYAPKLTSVSVSPSAEIEEGISVNLTCSSDANPAASYTWYKDNADLPKASGQIFTITDITPEHSGKYSCEAQNTRGRHRFTVHLTVSGSRKAAAVGATTAVALLAILLFVFILMRKKRRSKQSSDPVQRADNQEQDDLHYASVQFSKNQEESLYCNVTSAQPQRHTEKEDEGVVYSAVKYSSGSSSQETGEDSAALYSTVKKSC